MPDSRHPCAGHPESGIQMHEATVFLVVLLILVAVVGNLLRSAKSAEEFSGEVIRVTAANQEILDEMRDAMIDAVAVFQQVRASDGDCEARSWLDRIDLPAGSAPIDFACLPRLTTTSAFGKELVPGGRTGNALMFVKPSRDTEIRGANDRRDTIHTYRLVCYYLTPAGDGPKEGSGSGLNLCRFISVPMADAAQIDAIGDPMRRTEVLRGLVGGRSGDVVNWVWRRNATPTQSLLRIDPMTTQLVAGARLPADEQLSRWAILPYRLFSVATNFASGSTGVGTYGHRTDERGGFPHGFEVQLAGPASARQVMMHLTLITTQPSGAPASADLRAIALVHDR